MLMETALSFASPPMGDPTGIVGDNVLEGRAGDDHPSGGDGLDTAVFSGSSGEYRIRKDGGKTIGKDTRPHRDGTDVCQTRV